MICGGPAVSTIGQAKPTLLSTMFLKEVGRAEVSFHPVGILAFFPSGYV
jgi:hypothetical protein